MKGPAKRFVDHEGEAYDTRPTRDSGPDATPTPGDSDKTRDVGILGLWRYASFGERLATASGVLLSACCACGVIAAVALYGELTALFVSRHNAHASTGHARILTLFGGGRHLPAGNRSLHMDALLEDSVAFAWASAAVMCVQWATAAAAVRLAAGAASATAHRLRRTLLAHALNQELAYYDTNSKVNVAAALAEDVEALRAGAGEHTVMTTYLLGSVAAGVALALAYGWQLALVGLAVVPLAIAVAVTVAKYQTRCAAEEVSCYGAAGRVVEQALANIRTVRAFAGEQIEVQSYLRALSPARGVAARRGLAAGAGAGLGWLLTYTINAVVFAYGAALCAWDMHLPPEQQTYHPGVMVTVLFCTFMAAQNIAMCLPHLEVLSSARGAATSLYALLDRQTQISLPPGGGVRPDAFRGDITFDNLYFNYPSRPDVKVLRGLTLRVKAGETVALVGGSGCGKSTLLQLLQRLYEPDSGQLAVDGHRLQDLHIGHYRRSIGVVGQEPVLFSGSVRDNIALGVEHASHEDIVAAAKTAHAHQFISKLPQGYDTMLGERGALLSGGQKQRVAIARAVLRRPAVLLLDEPTSALDPGAERRVQAALDAAAEGRTTIVVSHRLSTIASASRIVFVEQGAVLEQGSHRELVRLRGAYWRLLQADMAHRSVPSPVPAAASEDDDEVVVRGEGPEAVAEGHFQRASTRQSRTRASVCRASVLRGSQRLGPVALAAPAGADTTYEQQEESPDAEEAEAEAEEPVPAVSSWSLLQLNAPEWALLLGGGVASLLMGATMPVFALLFSKLYGMFALSDAAEVLRRSQVYAGAFGAVALLCGAATFLQAWLFSAAGARLTHRLREHTFANFLRQEQGWFDSPRNSVGALCARLATDCKAVQGATGTRLGTVLQAASTMLLGVALALPYSWDMTLVSLLSVPCVIGAIYLEGVVSRRGEALQRRALEHASRLATEATLNLATVQSLGVESTILSRYGAALRVAGARSRAAARARGPVYGLCLCAPTLGYAVSLAYGGYLVARHDLPYEYAILVSEALIYGAWMLAEALSFAPSFAAARRSGARIVLALRREPTIRSELADAHEPTAELESGAVEYSNISFRYPTRPGREVLRGLSLRLPPGRTLALVGDSGCGKSTLGHLLMRTYDPQEGTVSLSGLDVRLAAPLHWVRAQLGAVSQEPALFARSLRDNIAYGDSARRVHMDEIVAAAKQANIHNFIAALPMGYDTVLCGGGAQLSGGQKQRVAIARALLRRPAVLLLDEATSALDAASEKAVQSALVAASAGRTTLVIAHRLATVRHAHQIALLKDGVVAELGTHEELVARRGLYWDLLQQQAPHSDTEHTDTDTGHTDTDTGHTDTGHSDS